MKLTLASLFQTSLFIFLFITSQAQLAQHSCEHQPGKHVHTCGLQAIYEDMNTHVPPPADFTYGGERDVVISVTYNGFTAEAQAAFQYAVDIWASLLTSNVPIVVDATWSNLGGGTLGAAGANGYWINFSGAPEADTYYPAPLADKLAGYNIEPGAADIVAEFNSTTDWYFGTDGNTPGGQFDFVTVVLHELGHGLGVVGFGDVSGGLGYVSFAGDPSIYDTFTENGSGTALTSYAEGSTTLATQLQSGNIFWNGPLAVANNGGNNPEMYAPGSWEPGSSYSHVDENTYPAGSGNSLMTPFVGQAESNHDPGGIIIGLMGDIGWELTTDGGCDANEATLTLFTDCWGGETSWEITDDGGNVLYSANSNSLPNLTTINTPLCLDDGCYTFTIFDSYGDGLGGTGFGCETDGDYEITDGGGNILVSMPIADFGLETSHDFCVEGGGGGDIFGCTDPGANNYNPAATIDDGSCTYDVFGCTDPTANNYNPAATVDDGSCTYDGCDFNQIVVDLVIDCYGEEVAWNITDDGGNIIYEVLAGTYPGTGAAPLEFGSDDQVVLCLEDGCYTFNITDTFGDGMYGSQWGGCEANGDYIITEGGDVLVEMTAINADFGDAASHPFCVGDLGACLPFAITATQGNCQDDGTGTLLPVINLFFEIDGACNVEDLCFEVDGGGATCFNMPTEGFLIYDQQGINLINTTPDSQYEIWFTTADGTSASIFFDNGNCDTAISGCTNPYADNYNPAATAEDGSCTYTQFLCDCAGTQHTLGVAVWVGDGFADDGSFDWDGQPVDFNCADWGYDCGDIAGSPTDDPYNVCSGAEPINMPPNNGCGGDILGCTDPAANNYNPAATIDDGSCIYDGCVINSIDIYPNGCGANGIQDMEYLFDFTGDCIVQEICIVGLDGGNDFCADLSANNLGDGDVWGWANFGTAGVYEFYYTLNDGTVSPIGSLDLQDCTQNAGCTNPYALNYDSQADTDDGSCAYDDTICDCAGTVHTIGVLVWIGDGFADDGGFDWDGQPVDFNCNDWAFDCGDINGGNGTDPYNVCDGSFPLNMPPNNGCGGDVLGCTDPAAVNYNPAATIDDGSCIYDSECWIDEDFDGMGNGTYAAQNSADITTWSGAEGGAEDAQVTNSNSFSAPHSMEIEQTDAELGGTTDIWIPMGEDAGTVSASWMMDVAAGFGGYFNTQMTAIAGEGWAFEFFFNPDGTWQLVVDAEEQANGVYPAGWFAVEVIADLDDNTAVVLINGFVVHQMDWFTPFGGINFFAFGGEGILGHYYIDDFAYCPSLDVLGCTDFAATNYDATATIDDDSCIYDGGCTSSMTAAHIICTSFNDVLVPQIDMVFSITNGCFVEDWCIAPAGGAVTCFNLPDLDIIIEDGDGLFYFDTQPNTSYEIYYTLSDGSVSQSVFIVTGDCDDEEQICDCDGNQHAIGATTWLGNGQLNDGSITWAGVPLNFNCQTWGFDCGDGGVIDDPNGVCEGNLPPNNGCDDSTCLPLNLTVSQYPCLWNDEAGLLLPTIQFEFDINGACQVIDFCFQVDGGGFACTNLPGIDIDIFDGDGLFLNNTAPGSTYDFYYVTDDGSTSPIFTWVNGDCENEEEICDCDGNVHTIGVLTWLGDTFLDDGSFEWNGQTVNFDCETWGYDCGDGGVFDDPNGVCDGNMPPNNGCVGDILGCTDPAAVNYNPAATVDDGSCTYNEVFGCTDSAAINYNPAATTDDGSCIYDIMGCTDPGASNYNPDATIDDGTCVYDIEGCTQISACNYNPDATVDDGSCDFSCYGCTNPSACNYDPDATIEDGSCDFTCLGCTDPGACNYDPDATIDNGSCDYTCLGCTDNQACNWDPFATMDDGSCDYDCYGCTDPDATNYDPDATIDDGSCIYDDIEGCTDPNACNYDEFANVEDGSCEYVTCAGCTDSEACNYDPDATIDDASCDYSCYGCTDPTATNYDPDATIDDGSCIYGPIEGCTDPDACNYDEFATDDDGSCEYESCAGCTDTTALNYDSTATIDDGSCVYDCVYPIIIYTPFCEDGEITGFYIEMEIDDLGNGAPYTVSNNQNADEIQLTFSGIIELGPFDNGDQVVISIVSQIYPECFITSPLLTMNCDPDNIEETSFAGAKIFPNPNSGEFTISMGDHFGPITMDIYDIAGKLVVSEQFTAVEGENRPVSLNGDLAFGTYVLRLGSDAKTEQFRLVIR